MMKQRGDSVKKACIILVFITIVLFFTSCNYRNEYEEKAEKFINLYYSQYEKKIEIEEILTFNDNIISAEAESSTYGIHDNIFEKKIEEYFEQNFDDIITEDEKLRLIRNRVIPNADAINSDIVKATVSSIEFDESNNQNEYTLLFSAIIIYEHVDGENTKSEEKGIISLAKDDDGIKVNYFEIN